METLVQEQATDHRSLMLGLAYCGIAAVAALATMAVLASAATPV